MRDPYDDMLGSDERRARYGTQADTNSFYNSLVQGQSGFLGNLMEQVLGQRTSGFGLPVGLGGESASATATNPTITTTTSTPLASSAAGAPAASSAAPAAASASKMGYESWLPLLIGQLGSTTIGGLLSPKPEKRRSFLDRGVDPAAMLSNSNDKANQLYALLMDYFSQPVSFKGSYAPAVPGSSVQDPAISDPSLLTRPGMLDQSKFAESWAQTASKPKTPVRRRTTSGNF